MTIHFIGEVGLLFEYKHGSLKPKMDSEGIISYFGRAIMHYGTTWDSLLLVVVSTLLNQSRDRLY